VLFIRDAIKFPDVIHSLKPDPITFRQEPNRIFDFMSQTCGVLIGCRCRSDALGPLQGRQLGGVFKMRTPCPPPGAYAVIVSNPWPPGPCSDRHSRKAHVRPRKPRPANIQSPGT
jgi:hypothetical protein